MLGENQGAAIEYFRQRAVESEDAGPAEVLVALLARAGRAEEAFEASAELIKPEMRTSGFAPSMIELATRAGSYERLMTVGRDRDDAAGLHGRSGRGECTSKNGIP